MKKQRRTWTFLLWEPVDWILGNVVEPFERKGEIIGLLWETKVRTGVVIFDPIPEFMEKRKWDHRIDKGIYRRLEWIGYANQLKPSPASTLKAEEGVVLAKEILGKLVSMLYSVFE